MTTRLLLFMLVATLLSFQACKEDPADAGELILNFTATYDTDPLVLLAETYTYPSGAAMKAQLLNYFVSDLTLLKSLDSENGAQLLTEIELVSYENTYDEESARAGVSFSFADLPAGEYAGIRLGLGVVPRLNATQPGDYAPGHPLAENYWSPATGYIFAKVEGTADVDADGEFETGLTYHTGADELYSELVFSSPLTVQAGTPATINFQMDLQKILAAADGTYLDISNSNLTIDHTVKPEIYEFLWENWKRALSVK